MICGPIQNRQYNEGQQVYMSLEVDSRRIYGGNIKLSQSLPVSLHCISRTTLLALSSCLVFEIFPWNSLLPIIKSVLS